MNTKKCWKLLALIALVALLFAACGTKEEAPAATEAPAAPAVSQEAAPVELGLKDWTMESTLWSGANGATVDLTATPTAYAEGLTAAFVVRLEGEDVSNVPCEWNGTAFTSYADLNAEDGYCYYVILTSPAGEELTVEVNTPTTPFNDALINLAASMESYCHTTVADATFENHKLTITQGSVQIQIPRISSTGDAVTCTEAELILNLDGGALAKTSLELPTELNADGSYSLDLAGISFTIPEMKDDHQLALSMMATLSDGTTLTDESNISWFYTDGNVQLTVG